MTNFKYTDAMAVTLLSAALFAIIAVRFAVFYQ